MLTPGKGILWTHFQLCLFRSSRQFSLLAVFSLTYHTLIHRRVPAFSYEGSTFLCRVARRLLRAVDGDVSLASDDNPASEMIQPRCNFYYLHSNHRRRENVIAEHVLFLKAGYAV
jgi:hypothetical protein